MTEQKEFVAGEFLTAIKDPLFFLDGITHLDLWNYMTMVFFFAAHASLQEAFHKFIGQPVSVFCSSRTVSSIPLRSNAFHNDYVSMLLNLKAPDHL